MCRKYGPDKSGRTDVRTHLCTHAHTSNKNYNSYVSLYRKRARQKMLLQLKTIAVNISVGSLIFFIYFKLKNIYYIIKKNTEELLKAIQQDAQQDAKQDSKLDRLSAIVAEGGIRQYLGRELQLSDIDGMTPQDLDKLYCRNEAKPGASMTKTLDYSFINLYVMGCQSISM